ncbi:hypothetical protein HDU97_007592 [Phlyctochytrium planicorne]|nr:hypothetical protein HDU97_007592 [Phlyctochytrium planicorne]
MPSIGTVLGGSTSQYVLREIKGHGSFSTVFIAQCIIPPRPTASLKLKRGDKVAVKCLVKAVGNEAAVEAQKRECEFLMKLQSQQSGGKSAQDGSDERRASVRRRPSKRCGVVGFYEVVESEHLLFFVLEYCPIDLYHAITQNEGFSQAVVKGLFPQLADAVSYCHDMGIYHRDLKPENVLIDTRDFSIRLTDFGLATNKSWSTEMGCGSVRYMAPECMGLTVPGTAKASGSKNAGYASAPNDVWALGIILINLIFARNPWHSPSDPFCLEAYLGRREPVLIGEFGISKEFDSVLRRCFDPNPATRATVTQLKNLVAAVPSFIDPTLPNRKGMLPPPPPPPMFPTSPVAGGLVGGSPTSSTNPASFNSGRKASVDVLSSRLPLTFLQISLDHTRSPSFASNASSNWDSPLEDNEIRPRSSPKQNGGALGQHLRSAASTSSLPSRKPSTSPGTSPVSSGALRKARRMAPPSHIDLPSRHITDFGMHRKHRSHRQGATRQPFDELDLVYDEDQYLVDSGSPSLGSGGATGYAFHSPDWSLPAGDDYSGYGGTPLSPIPFNPSYMSSSNQSNTAAFFGGVSPPAMMDAKMASLRIAENWTRYAVDADFEDDRYRQEDLDVFDDDLVDGGDVNPYFQGAMMADGDGSFYAGGVPPSFLPHGLPPTPSEEDVHGMWGGQWSPRFEGPRGFSKHSFDSGFESSPSSLLDGPPGSRRAGPRAYGSNSTLGSSGIRSAVSPGHGHRRQLSPTTSNGILTPPLQPPSWPSPHDGRVRRAQSDAILAQGNPLLSQQQPLHRFASFNHHYQVHQHQLQQLHSIQQQHQQQQQQFREKLSSSSAAGGLRRSSTSVTRFPSPAPSGSGGDMVMPVLGEEGRSKSYHSPSSRATSSAGLNHAFRTPSYDILDGSRPQNAALTRASSVGPGTKSHRSLQQLSTPASMSATLLSSSTSLGSLRSHSTSTAGTSGRMASSPPPNMFATERLRKLSIPEHMSRYAVMGDSGVSSDDDDGGLSGGSERRVWSGVPKRSLRSPTVALHAQQQRQRDDDGVMADVVDSMIPMYMDNNASPLTPPDNMDHIVYNSYSILSGPLSAPAIANSSVSAFNLPVPSSTGANGATGSPSLKAGQLRRVDKRLVLGQPSDAMGGSNASVAGSSSTNSSIGSNGNGNLQGFSASKKLRPKHHPNGLHGIQKLQQQQPSPVSSVGDDDEFQDVDGRDAMMA